MKKTHKLLIALLGVIVLTVVGFEAMQSKEPEYQGRKLSEWIADFEQGETRREQAIVALRAMGPRVLPVLVDMAAFDSMDWKFRLRLWLAKHGLGRQGLKEDNDNGGRACLALCALEADAHPAIPQLVAKLATVKSEDTLIIAVLEVMGAASVPELMKALHNSTDNRLKHRVITVLRLLHEDATPALPDLLAIRKESEFQSNADAAIRSISPSLAEELKLPKR